MVQGEGALEGDLVPPEAPRLVQELEALTYRAPRLMEESPPCLEDNGIIVLRKTCVISHTHTFSRHGSNSLIVLECWCTQRCLARMGYLLVLGIVLCRVLFSCSSTHQRAGRLVWWRVGRFLNCNKCITLLEDVDSGGDT